MSVFYFIFELLEKISNKYYLSYPFNHKQFL